MVYGYISVTSGSLRASEGPRVRFMADPGLRNAQLLIPISIIVRMQIIIAEVVIVLVEFREQIFCLLFLSLISEACVTDLQYSQIDFRNVLASINLSQESMHDFSHLLLTTASKNALRRRETSNFSHFHRTFLMP